MLTGSTNEEKIWNYLKSYGLNDFGTAGLMGNLYAESALSPINLQNTYEKTLGYTDQTYTSAVDNGKYGNFVYDSAGYGLAQWTYWSRKQNLLNCAKRKGKSIGDLEMQLEFLLNELSEYGLLNALRTATSVRSVSDTILLQFEKPADQSDAVKAKRAGYGQTYYDKYATKVSKSSVFTPRMTKPEAGNKYYITKSSGGYSYAVKGSPTDSSCDVLSNCVGYAYGRFNEIGGWGSCKYLSPVNAENFIQYKGDLEVSQAPQVGSCMVWQKGATLSESDGAGHVAIVEKVVNSTEVITSESAYGGSAFWTQTRKKGNDGNWGQSNSFKFLGFILNPAPCCKSSQNSENSEATSTPMYRVRKSWEDVTSQIGAYISLENAKAIADKNPGYTVYDKDGNAVYPITTQPKQELEDEDMTQEKFNEMFSVAMTAYRKSLQDNDAGSWSEADRKWAIESGLFKGSGTASDGKPNYMWEDLVTRESMAALLHRLYEMK